MQKYEISELDSRRAEAEKRADYLKHVAREIEEAQLIAGEDVKLEDEARRLENASGIRATAMTGASFTERQPVINQTACRGRFWQSFLGAAAGAGQHLSHP